MRWIQHDKSKIKRGEASPPEDNVFFVDEKGSRAIVGGKLYIDGRRAPQGKHSISLKDEDLEIDVNLQGRVMSRMRKMRKGMKGGIASV